jgi:VanZ family protein
MFFFLITFCCGVSLVLWEKPLWWLLLMLPLCWLDEASKPMISGRHFSWVDVGKNAAGAGAGMLLTIVVWVIQRKRS